MSPNLHFKPESEVVSALISLSYVSDANGNTNINVQTLFLFHNILTTLCTLGTTTVLVLEHGGTSLPVRWEMEKVIEAVDGFAALVLVDGGRVCKVFIAETLDTLVLFGGKLLTEVVLLSVHVTSFQFVNIFLVAQELITAVGLQINALLTSHLEGPRALPLCAN